ncbi:hypothetical protein [Agaribacterium haliotis]|uniref:hypothetical protein n=1 Tax=Agaribacterium haliotis TaxID=2013869 RepID=UPI000BB53685|nr:hypothetical protein [Agaribacterium haliotis]
MKIKKLSFTCFKALLVSVFFFVAVVHASEKKVDQINTFSAVEYIGGKEKLRVDFDVDIKKARDIYILVRYFDTWKNISERRLRIKKSGTYHVELDTEGLKPGQYRVGAYMTPRGKNWNARVGNEMNSVFTVVDSDVYQEQVVFSDTDKVDRVRWPKEVGNEENTLHVNYSITQPRDLHIKLFDKQSNQAVTTIVYPLTKPGEWSLPITKLAEKIPAGGYVWVVYVSESKADEAIGEKYHMPFDLTAG